MRSIPIERLVIGQTMRYIPMERLLTDHEGRLDEVFYILALG
jgi:hypothetical protein